LLGWGRRATQGVRTYDVPGGHSSMLQEPNVQTLAARLQEQIDERLAGHVTCRHSPSLLGEQTVATNCETHALGDDKTT
jgi:hypothetical protein